MGPSLFQASIGKTGETKGREEDGRKGKKEKVENEDKGTAMMEGQVTDKVDNILCQQN